MKKLSLNLKITLVLSIFVASSILISTVGLMRVSAINDSLNSLVDLTVRRLVLAKNIDKTIIEIRNQEKKFILSDSVDAMKEVGAEIGKKNDQLIKETNDLIKIATVNKPLLEESLQKLAQWRELDLEMQKLALSGKTKEAYAMANGPNVKIMKEVGEVAGRVVEKAEHDMDSESKRTDDLVASTRTQIISVSVLSLGFGLFLAFFILRAVNRSIDTVITTLDQSSQQVASAAHQIAATSEELSQSSTEQAASLEQTAASVEEMTSMVSKNSDSARKTSENADHTQEAANKGQKTVELMIQSIGDISEANSGIVRQIEDSNAKISEIVHVISEIGDKTKVINEIVFQTKLLSFNASVEAARAGEYGKGFAVVAEEVGNLAEMSGNAAKEITSMLDASIKKVQAIVSESSTSVQRMIVQSRDKVETGTRVANDCGRVLTEIVTNINTVAQMAVEISAASQEQSKGITEISKAMAQLDQVTQQNSASSEEAASAAEELSAQAETLKAGVLTLIETIRGAGAHQPTAGFAAAPKKASKSVVAFKPRTAAAPKHEVVQQASGSDFAPSYDDDRFGNV